MNHRNAIHADLYGFVLLMMAACSASPAVDGGGNNTKQRVKESSDDETSGDESDSDERPQADAGKSLQTNVVPPTLAPKAEAGGSSRHR